MSQLNVTDKLKIVEIARRDPSWIPIRFAPFHYQAVFVPHRSGMPFFVGAHRLPEDFIDAVVLNNVKEQSITACTIDRGPFQFMVEDSRIAYNDWMSVHRHFDPFDVRQQLRSSDGTINPHNKHLVEQVEAVWTTMEIRFRRAHQYGHCRLLARVGSSHALHFSEVPADVFALCKITDWRQGNAQSADGDRLYALHVGAVSPKLYVATLNNLEDATKLETNIEIRLAVAPSSKKKQNFNEKDAAKTYKAWVAKWKEENVKPPNREEDAKLIRTLGGKRDAARQFRELYAPEWCKPGPKTKLKKIVKNTPPAKLPK